MLNNQDSKLFGWKILSLPNKNILSKVEERHLSNPFVINWLLDCKSYDTESYEDSRKSPYDFIKTVQQKDFLKYAKPEFIEFIIKESIQRNELIGLVMDITEYCDRLIVQGLLIKHADEFRSLIYDRDCFVSTTALKILNFCLVDRQRRLEIFNAANLSQILVISLKCWKENFQVDTEELLDLVLENGLSNNGVGETVDEFGKTCIEELKRFDITSSNPSSTIPSDILSKDGVVDMFLAMEKWTKSKPFSTNNIYALHLGLEFYESLGQEIVNGLDDCKASDHKTKLINYMHIFRLHINWICAHKSSLECRMKDMSISNSTVDTKITDFIDIFQVILQSSIQSLFNSSNSDLIPVCLNASASLVNHGLLVIDDLDIQRLRKCLSRYSDAYLLWSIYAILKACKISDLFEKDWLGRIQSEMLRSTKRRYIEAVLGNVEADLLAEYNKRNPDLDHTAIVEMAREFRNLIRDMKSRHAEEIEKLKGECKGVDDEIMKEVESVSTENLELKGKCRLFEDKVGSLDKAVHVLEQELEQYKAENSQLRQTVQSSATETAKLVEKLKEIQVLLDSKQQEIIELKGMVDEEREYQQVLASLAEKVSARKRFGTDKPMAAGVLRERNTDQSPVADLSAVMFE